jgi:hypothetical protein
LATRTRGQSISDNQRFEDFNSEYKNIASLTEETVWIVCYGRDSAATTLKLAYAMPNKLIMGFPPFGDAAYLNRVAKRVGSNTLICSETEFNQIFKGSNQKPAKVASLKAFENDLKVFSLRP